MTFVIMNVVIRRVSPKYVLVGYKVLLLVLSYCTCMCVLKEGSGFTKLAPDISGFHPGLGGQAGKLPWVPPPKNL